MTAPTLLTKLSIDWIDVKNKCRITVNKEDSLNPVTPEFKQRLLLSEHSPIRLLRVSWKWSLKSWIAVHFSRHHIGWEKWVSTQRNDRTGIDRDTSTQDTMVNMSIEANAQALINVSKVRLCYNAHTEAREHMEDLKRALYGTEPELAEVMQPNCVYRCGCPEFAPCGYWRVFTAKHSNIDFTDITERYKAANEDFFGGKR